MVKERSWSDLPQDVLNLIRPHVSDQSPYLMAFINNVKCKFYHPVFGNTYNEDFPELELCNSRISSSNFGWLLMNEGLCFLTFFNPFTFEMIDIPILDDDKFEIFSFSAPPTSSECTIFAMKNHNFSDVTEIGIIKRGDADWSISEFEGKFKTSFCNGVFYDGRYYFMGDEFNVGIFDVKTNDWKVCDKRIVPHRKRYLYRPIGMAENNGGMLVVYESREHQQLNLARFDLLNMTWEKVDCLGEDKVLYVSQGASYLETTAAKGMGNKIYFPNFFGSDGIFYCLATNNYYSSNGRYCGERCYELVQPRFCTWIKPNYSRLNIEGDSESDDIEVENSDIPFFLWRAPILEG